MALCQRLKYPVRLLRSPDTLMTKSNATATVLPPATYESALEELEQLVARLESGDMPLEQLMGGYQRGAELLQYCRARLESVENQVKVLEAGTLKTWTAE